MLWNLLLWVSNKISCALGKHTFRLGAYGRGPYCGDCDVDLDWNGVPR